MKYVVALDVSMGKSTMVIYNQYRQCEVEKEIDHNRPSFQPLHKTLQALTHQGGQVPEIVFEAIGVFSKPLERFFQDHHYTCCRINPLETNLQMAPMRRQKNR